MIALVHTSEEFYDMCKRSRAGEITIHNLEVGSTRKTKRKTKDGQTFLYRVHYTENQPVDNL